MLSWVVLAVSGLFEAVWATALSRSEGFTKLVPSIIFVGAVVISMGGLAWAVDASNHGFTVEVRKEAEALAALRKANPQSVELQLIEPQARALFLQGSGLPDSAVAVLRAAARLEASQPAQALPRPAYEALGEMLYWLGRNAEAQDAFQQSLARTPGRARSITGLALSARAGGDTAVADRAMAQLRANFQAADEGAVESMLKSVRKGK